MNWPALFTGLLGRRDEGRHAVSSPRVPPALAAGQQDLDAREREIIVAHAACQTAPNGTGAWCTCEFRCANFWLRAVRQGRVSWAPKPSRPVALTTPMPVAPARPYAPPVRDAGPLDHDTPVWPDVRPVIGDAMNAAFPAPPPPVPPVPDCAALPYTEPGWAGLQMRRWVERGEWERADSALLAGYERNAADMGVALVRSRARIVEALALGCAGLGLPVLADELLRRTSELTAAAHAANAGGAR